MGENDLYPTEEKGKSVLGEPREGESDASLRREQQQLEDYENIGNVPRKKKRKRPIFFAPRKKREGGTVR